jgi:hypothetical protein
VGDIMEVIGCFSFGQWHGIPDRTKLHNALVRHDPRCDGNCDATWKIEELRAEGRLVGKPRHQIRAATNGS